jgi:hypothetical protein
MLVYNKQCTKCKKIKDASNFYKDKHNKTGLRSNCIKCCNKQNSIWHQKNKEKVKKRHIEYNKKHAIEMKEYRKKYYDRLEPKYSHYKRNANIRGFSFLITIDEFEKLISQPCFYCGGFDGISNGVDRLNNLESYKIENCVPCCKRCNKMKHVLSKMIFLEHVEKIYKHVNGKLYDGN